MLRSDPPCLFTGDLIFVCGNGTVTLNLNFPNIFVTPYPLPPPNTHTQTQTVGKMFEGSPDVMLTSIKRIMDLPSNCLLYPGDIMMVTFRTI